MQDMLVVWLLAVLVSSVKAQLCDYTQYMEPGGASFRIQSQGAYTRGSSCTWRAFTRQGSVIEITCTINIPQYGQSCLDQLYVSSTQDRNEGKIYCGRQTISERSTGNQMLVQINVDKNSPGGSFSCDIKAVQGSGSSSCQCGYSYKTRIVGGQETGINEFPMMAALLNANSNGVTCGATIVSQRFSVTAGHCLKGQIATQLALLVGDHDLSTGRETDASQAIRVSDIYVHPNFDESLLINDIGMVKLVSPLRFTMRVGPACLPFTHPESHQGQPVQVLGWGTTEFGGPKATKLQKATLNVQAITRCQHVYGSKIYPYGQLCLERNNTDACQYDSGGPVLWLDSRTNRLMLVGIISYGRGCAMKNPSVNTRTYAYLGWIEEILQNDAVCVV